MASSYKTSHLRLSYWSGADSPKMNDFNEDNQKLDEFASSVPTKDQLRQSLIYPAQCRYQDGIFHLSELPENLPVYVTVRFAATANYTKGDKFHVNGYHLTPCLYDFTPLPDKAFKAMALISFEADLNGGWAFFKFGGDVVRQEDSSFTSASYHIFLGDTPPENEPDGLFVSLQEPVEQIVLTPCLKRRGEFDSRCSFKMPISRFSFTPFLYENKIYCIGGRNGTSVYNTVYIMDLDTGEWSAGSSAPVSIADYMLAIISNKAYLIGGRTSTSNRIIYSYCMDTDSWLSEGSVSSEITSLYFSGSVAVDGLIYLLLGTRNGSTSTQSYVLDPETGLMTELAISAHGTTWAKAFEKDGIIYVVGRSTNSAPNKSGIMGYHIESNLWTLLYSDPQNRAYMGACMEGEFIYTVGGIRSSTFGESPMEDIRVYDTQSGLWSETGTVPNPKHGAGMVAGPEGIYCMGGAISGLNSSGDSLSAVELLWAQDDSYPPGTLVIEYGLPGGRVDACSALLGRIGGFEMTLGIRRAFFFDEGSARLVPFMVNRGNSGWVQGSPS